jgi:hypothetical protein
MVINVFFNFNNHDNLINVTQNIQFILKKKRFKNFIVYPMINCISKSINVNK